jgi:PHP family Zn ribbon phosphoesterase
VHDFRDRWTQTATVNEKNEIQFEFLPKFKGEYKAGIYLPERSWPADPLFLLSFFVVAEDLSRLRPYRGDLHMHSSYSDGKESPAFMAASARECGLDFAAITDHRVFDSSIMAIREAEENGFDILLFPGEEVNYCLGLGHIVSINADKSIAGQFRLNEKTAGKNMLERLENINQLIDQVYEGIADEVDKKKLPAEVDKRLYGFYYGIVKRIHEAGGFAISAHPFWISNETLDMVQATYEYVLKKRLFDAVEIFGGVNIEANMLSLSRIHFEQMSGPEIPVVGSSDAHDAVGHNMGRTWTVVFSAKLEREAILNAIREHLTTACLISKSHEPIVTGPFHLVEYTYFLLREFFPRHDEICRTLGGMYKSVIRKRDLEKIKIQQVLQAELDSLYETYFGQSTAVREAST